MPKLVLFMLPLLFLTLIIGTIGCDEESGLFPDPNLEEAIRDAIDKPVGEIKDYDLVPLSQLSARDKGIAE